MRWARRLIFNSARAAPAVQYRQHGWLSWTEGALCFRPIADSQCGIGPLISALKSSVIVSVVGVLLAGCAGGRPAGLAAYHERYDKPLLSPGAQFAALPPAVQGTIRAETGSADIAEVVKDTSSGGVVFRIDFQNRALFPPLYIAADGSVLDPDLTVAIGAPLDTTSIITGGPVAAVTLNDLPPVVVKTIQRRAPDAQVGSIVKEVHGDQTTYIVTFKDRLHPAMRLASDGTVLAESPR